MPDQEAELVAVKLEESWFLTLKRGDPSHGLMVSEECAQLINAANALLTACSTAYLVISKDNCSQEELKLLAESALVQLDTAIRLATGDLV